MSRQSTQLQGSLPGFSLVEILVVISIVAVLISMLLPSLSATREAIRKSDCSSRQKQMYAMTMFYYSDYKQYWPVPYQGHTAKAGVPGYRVALNLYFQYPRVGHRRDWGKRNPMMCLASKSIDAESTAFYGTPAFPWNWDGIDSQGRVLSSEPPTSYTINPYFYEGNYGNAPDKKARKGMPRSPQLTMLYVEAWKEARVHYWYKTAGTSFMRFRHNETGPTANDGSLNMTYADGAVKNWQYDVKSPIYPVSGNGLFTTQPGFLWSPFQ